MSATKRILAMVALGLGLAAAQSAAPPSAECGWCPTYKCFGPCGGDCRCVSTDHRGGRCMDIQLIPPGATLLE